MVVGASLGGVDALRQLLSRLPKDLPALVSPLPFLYEATGDETMFTDGFDPDPRSRSVFAFHRPETLARWLRQWRLADCGIRLTASPPGSARPASATASPRARPA